MPRFFVENAGDGGEITITGDDARHICLSLRMKPGEKLTVCTGTGVDCDCEIISADPSEVRLRIEQSRATDSEPDVRVTLYQGYPKGGKLETIIEKAVELGVYEVAPVLTERSVARPDGKAADRKLERWQRHASEAAKQCGRGIIPAVRDLVPFEAIEQSVRSHSLMLYFYELGGMPLGQALFGAGGVDNGTNADDDERAREPERRQITDVGIFIGPEGGISAEEAQKLGEWGAVPVTLGRRIMRTETAPIAALACIMLLTGNLE